MISERCSRCKGENDRPQHRYCRACHAAYMRETRPKHSELSLAQKIKARARSRANNALKNGTIKRSPCEVCASTDAEKHHDDYSRPLDVHWLCRKCHLAEHAAIKAMNVPRETLEPA